MTRTLTEDEQLVMAVIHRRRDPGTRVTVAQIAIEIGDTDERRAADIVRRLMAHGLIEATGSPRRRCVRLSYQGVRTLVEGAVA